MQIRIRDPKSGMEKFGSGINILDPQHWIISNVETLLLQNMFQKYSYWDGGKRIWSNKQTVFSGLRWGSREEYVIFPPAI